uniref:NADH dehydrogenase subunit 6 n=1 Tax=Purpuradusta gracilis TaxID=218390 RepID=UPI0023D89F4B|nr:NADH dehydrogenase subunit 6 [Purpuradusta gracilis]WDA98687.1 NADH dehydrogenase subunit 6 [Purpuradusta gracilis]
MTALMMLVFSLASLLMLPLMTQPLSLGLVIMISTLLMCSLTGMMLSSWYGYILFLIYVGGLLVMFAYVAALSPNTLFGSGLPLLGFLVLLVPLSVIFYFYPIKDFSMITTLNNYSEFMYLKSFGTELVSPNSVSILIGLGTILLLNLIVVVKICYYQHASLRPFNEV